MNSMIAQVYSLPTLIRESLPKFDENIRQTLDHQLCLSLKRVSSLAVGTPIMLHSTPRWRSSTCQDCQPSP